jgi:hypothetical protein
MKYLWMSLGQVSLGACLPTLASGTRLFSSVAGVYTGLDHYAEGMVGAWPASVTALAPMPLNTLVNLGYVGVGACWLYTIHKDVSTNKISTKQVIIII